MRKRLLPSLSIVLAVLVLGLSSLPAAAQSFGRIELTIVGPDGEPVQGVTITATCEELTKFEQIKETNKKGKALISVVDATKVYSFLIEHEGYPTLSRSLKPTLGDTTRVEIELTEELAEDNRQTTFTPAETAFNEGADALRAGDLAMAQAKFEESLELDPELTPAYSALAAVHLEQGNYEDAIRSAESFVAAEGPDANSYRIIYDAYVALGDQARSDAALKELRALLEEGNPEEIATLLYNDGVDALQRGDDRGAEASFSEALQVKPDLHASKKALAVLYARRGQWQEAVTAAESYLGSAGEDTACLQIRWEGYRALGDETKAAESMKALAEANPGPLAQGLFEDGQALFNAGKIADAAKQFALAIQIDPSLAAAHYQLGLCKLNQGDSAAAKLHIGHFLELAPADDPELAAAKEMLSYLE